MSSVVDHELTTTAGRDNSTPEAPGPGVAAPGAPVSDADDAQQPGAAARARSAAGSAGWAGLGLLALVVGYLPAARVPIIADDLHALFATYGLSDSFWGSLLWGAEQGRQGGHFNPIGQALGAGYHYLVYATSAAGQFSPQRVDVLASVVLIAAAVAGATYLISWGLVRSRTGRPAFWPLFAVLCAVTAATLQIHAYYTNDPVVSYGMAGFGSAALGFLTVGVTLRACAPRSSGRAGIVVSSVLSVVCIWYYEMLVAAVAAVAVALVLVLLTSADRAAIRRRVLVLLGTSVVLPAVAFVVGRQFSAQQDADYVYAGTQVTIGWDSIRTWTAGMVGALPGGGWNYLAEMAGKPIVDGISISIAGALCLLIGVIGALWHRRVTRDAAAVVAPQHVSRAAVLVPVGTLVSFWAAATATQSITAANVALIQRPGQVYLFYAVGVVAVAGLLAVVVGQLPRRGRAGTLVVLLPVVGLFVAVQVASNLTVAAAVSRTYDQNASLVALSTNPDSDPGTRCDVLAAWQQGPWPPYYRDLITRTLQEDFERVYDQPFCASTPN